MAEKEYFIDDNVIISDKVKNMTHEERLAEIARLEKIAKAEKEKILQQKKL
ncbi:MAG: hypothetical protein J6K92_00650 [Oscillospiraceae bacterium]|nr:hypothetical protein [Oscillospiraceae bacterium]